MGTWVLPLWADNPSSTTSPISLDGLDWALSTSTPTFQPCWILRQVVGTMGQSVLPFPLL